MTNYEKYNEFLMGKVKPNNSTFNKNKRKKPKFKINQKSNNIYKKKRKPNINPGDIVSILYIEENITITSIVRDNYIKVEPRFNDNPKSDRGTKAFQLVSQNYINDDEISTLSEVYNLIKYNNIGDIIPYKEGNIKIVNIQKQ